jgi:hypothetical protein
VAWGGFDVIADVTGGEVDDDVSGISDCGAPLAASTNNQSVKLGSVRNVSNETNYTGTGSCEEGHTNQSRPQLLHQTRAGKLGVKRSERHMKLTILELRCYLSCSGREC